MGSSSSRRGSRGEEEKKQEEETDVPHDFRADYVLEDLILGTGSSCKVRGGTCVKTGKKVAVKSFDKNEVSTKAWESARREVEIHAPLSHAHIVKLEDTYDTGSELHIVLERLEGGELFDRVLQRDGLPEDEAAKIVVQILKAVGYMHARCIVHRDLKPENILFTKKRGDQIKLIDMGFATHCKEGRKLFQRCGTLQYAAPEVLAERGYTERADMWSVGGVTYTMLVARLLYGGSDIEVARKNREGRIDWSRSFSRLSWQAQEFVQALLCVDPAQRMSVREALEHPWLRKWARAEVKAAQAEVAAEYSNLRENAGSITPLMRLRSWPSKSTPQPEACCLPVLSLWENFGVLSWVPKKEASYEYAESPKQTRQT